MAPQRRAAPSSTSGARTQAAFTLIEVMVVIFIMGILVTLVAVSFGNRSLEDRMEIEAKRVHRVLELAIEEAELKGIDLGLRLTADQLQLLAMDPDKNWSEYAEDGPLRSREVTPPFYLDLFVEGRAVPPAQDSGGNDAGDKDSDGKDSDGKEKKKIEPQVLLLSSGEVTAFALELRAKELKPYYRLDADVLGKLTLERKEPK